MEVMEISGGRTLTGSIRISGAKNSSVALIPAAILSDGEVTICNVPEITDTDALTDILDFLGAKVHRASESIVVDSKSIENKLIPEDISSKLRASYYFMGAYEDGNKYIIDAERLHGANIYLDFASVGATINIMLAAVRADGITMIENAAKEPEIVNVATFLNNMGARISGAGTSVIRIEGVDTLNGCFHEVIPDRIEAGTYTIMAALVGKQLKIDNIIPEHLEALTSKLVEMGVKIEIGSDYFIITKPDSYKCVNLKTQVFPGFPTDLQQPFTVLLTQCKGTSHLEETIWENRFMHIPELEKMGAKINLIDNHNIEVTGPTKLIASTVKATDLRAGAAMVLAALIAEGQTTICDINHILRGYEGIIEKLSAVGAKIKIKEI